MKYKLKPIHGSFWLVHSDMYLASIVGWDLWEIFTRLVDDLDPNLRFQLYEQIKKNPY